MIAALAENWGFVFGTPRTRIMRWRKNMSALRRSLINATLSLLAIGSVTVSAAEFGLELTNVSVGSANGASAAALVTTQGTWSYDNLAATVTLNGSLQADFDLNPLPGNELFSHVITDAVISLDGTSITAAAFECIEGTFGDLVGANLCANTNRGSNGISETSWDYSTIPGTRVVSGDDVSNGPMQQLSDYASALNRFDLSVLVIESPAWTSNPGAAGIQMEFLVTNAPALISVPELLGLDRTEAESLLIAEGLSVGEVSLSNDPTAPMGQVITQFPFSCTDCALENDPVDLLVSLGPTPMVDVIEEIEALQAQVKELDLHPWPRNLLHNLLRGAIRPLIFCEKREDSSKQIPFSYARGNLSKRARQNSRAHRRICADGGEAKAVQKLQQFTRFIEILIAWKIVPADANSLIENADAIVNDILREPPSSGLYTIISLGVERSYYLRVPSNYSKSSAPLPIVFGLHGATGSYLDWFEGGFHGEGLQNVIGDQAIMVFPNAAVSNGGITLWNRDTDFDFFRDLLGKLQAELNIDPNKIFVTGHSAGAGFTHELGCAFGDIIRAIAPSSGAITATQCVGAVAVLQMQSSEDQVTPIGIVEPTRNLWIAYNGFDRDVFSAGITEPCIDYSLGASLYPVQWCMHASTGDNGHQWWDGADEAIWDFFSSLPTTVASAEPPPGGGNDRIVDEFSATLSFTVRYPSDMNPLTLLAAVLYPADTVQPIFSAPLWFLVDEIPFEPATPGTEQSYENIPIALPADSAATPLPGRYTLSISAFVEGGSFPIPATGIDHIALIELEIQDQFSPIIVDEVLDLVPVVGF